MVQLEEVPDDELNAQQPGPGGKEDDDEWDTDSGTLAEAHSTTLEDADCLQTQRFLM